MARRNWIAMALLAGFSVLAVPQAALAKDTKPVAAAAEAIDLNTATADQLETLPGIGPAKAKAIIDGRPYTSLKDFESRNIVAASTLDKLKGQVAVVKAKPAAVAEAPAGKLDLNSATVEELQALSGVGPVKAQAIVDGRPYTSLKDFESRNILAASTLDKLKGQVAVVKSKAKPAAAAADETPPEPVGKIDLNSATADELEVLPGVGPARAKKIVEGRPYASLAEFEAKNIVPASTFDKFKSATEVVPVGTAAAVAGTPGREAAQRRIKMCGAKWRAAKAEGKIRNGQTWPQYWSECNTALKNRGY